MSMRAGRPRSRENPLRNGESFHATGWSIRPCGLVRVLPTWTEDTGPMPWQVTLVIAVQSMDLQRPIEGKDRPGAGREGVREEHRSVLCDGDEAGIERRIEMGRKQQAVEDVEDAPRPCRSRPRA